ncbi:MAG: DUF3303 family protein [Methylobacterium sp.]|nr:DUF3303 family protein [Methylobacterium sp.]MCA3601672.1 DUF3303 family protein [Methylobacterium sp.]MCA3602619.1 DUF3303 family protein [Methylobacterium sp.]MCA3613429.1 DUF3303 family protein [Methylobacterium sp.]MCA3613663.1 DUF3303 family protein [Methylobacterium sp.]
MLFMVIEHFDQARVRDIYRRFNERGRMVPEGLEYVASWISADFDRCFQVMKCEDASLLQEWVLAWGDLARFEIVPIVGSKETYEAVKKHL